MYFVSCVHSVAFFLIMFYCQSVDLDRVLFVGIVNGCCMDATFVTPVMYLWFTEHFFKYVVKNLGQVDKL